ncbi:uncharacterized protein LOC122026845 [Zingiber officinale]|uniref:uncharacterized protein LOC122026845 n=1 Tax=Zingiber officinale TaxID=94328 RepID=UPI001C4D9B11|nr:uncharacterized protein LOC122026845 [Zingiber officinale]
MEESGRIHVTMTAGEYELFKEAKRLAASERQATVSRPRKAPAEVSKEPLPISDRGSKRKQPEVFHQHPYREPGIGYYQPEPQAQSLKKEQTQASVAESSQPRDSKKGKALVIPEAFPEDPDEKVPFSVRILNERLPKGYRAPSIGEYDGSKDPEDHLRKFKNAALLHQYSDAVKCRAFLNTLSGSALKWFDGLPQGSITCFLDFKTAFLRRFSSNKKYQKTDHCLFTLKQGLIEPLRSYINRFNQVAQDVPTATSEILMSAFSHGLGEGEWKKHKQLEGRPKDHFLPITSKREECLNHPLNLYRESGKPDLPFIPGQKFDLLLELLLYTSPDQGQGFARDSKRAAEMGLPPPELAPQLIKMMEEQRMAGQAGSSRPDLARPSTHQPGRGKEPEGSREVENRANATVREIGMISGGPTDGDSGRAHKSHVRRLEVHAVGCSQEQAAGPVLSFGPADLEGLELPHDALIIKAIIANSRVARVFVDTGSSVNILFRTAFEEMQIDAAELQPVATSLYGFTGNEVKPMGQIKLAISLGTEPLVRTRRSTFIVVDSSSSYNVILGRPALHEFMAAVSTFHQKIKFPMGEQVGEVRGE